jgi:4-aminobutyrate aminotransferase-like enzyme
VSGRRLRSQSETHKRRFEEGLKGNIPARGRKYGLVLDVGGYYKNVFTLAPSLHITEDEIDLGLELLESLLQRCGAC